MCDGVATCLWQLPCTPKPCVPICKPVTKYVSYGAFKLPYTENVCVDDKACLTANAKCIATLQAAMKAAEAAEKDMIAKSKAANSAKATKAQKDAAAASKKAEEAAAKKSLDGAKAAFEVAEKETATAKAASVAAAAAFAAKSKVMNTRLGEYEKAKAGHLNAQKAYANAKGEAAEAADAYAAAVKDHCDAEAVHAKAVENIGHGHLKQDKCAKPGTRSTAASAPPLPPPPPVLQRHLYRIYRSLPKLPISMCPLRPLPPHPTHIHIAPYQCRSFFFILMQFRRLQHLRARPVSRARAGLEGLAALSTATPPSRTVQAHARTPQTAASRGGNWTSARRRRW